MKAKGLVLVLRRGVFALLQAWSQWRVVGSEAEKDGEETDPYLMPEDIRHQTAAPLATMALDVQREASSICMDEFARKVSAEHPERNAYLYNPEGKAILDPDEQIRRNIAAVSDLTAKWCAERRGTVDLPSYLRR